MLKRLWMPLAVIAAMLLSIGPLSVGTASAQQIYTPERGSQERKLILDAIRPLLEARVGAPVEFVVNRMRVYQDWAWLVVDPQRPGGGEIATSGPDFKMWEDLDGLTTYALLRQAYGRWNLIDYAIGPTDVFWDGDPLYKQFPRAFLYDE